MPLRGQRLESGSQLLGRPVLVSYSGTSLVINPDTVVGTNTVNNWAIGLAASLGSMGLIGATGPSGAAGATGPSGVTGVSGSTGPTGSAGSGGAAGPIGATGPSGAGRCDRGHRPYRTWRHGHQHARQLLYRHGRQRR